MVANRKHYLATWNQGSYYIEFYSGTSTCSSRSSAISSTPSRRYGFEDDRRIEQDQCETRASIYIDDDLETRFKVDIPNDRYTLIIGVGFVPMGPNGYAGFGLDAEGLTVRKSLPNSNYARCTASASTTSRSTTVRSTCASTPTAASP